MKRVLSLVFVFLLSSANLSLSAPASGTSLMESVIERSIEKPDDDPPEYRLRQLEQALQSGATESSEQPLPGQIHVSAIPADTMIDLRWNTSGLRLPTGSGLTFTVHLGTQSGKYSRTIEAGSGTSIRLRDLTNGKQYFIAVRGTLKEGGRSLWSSEISAIPEAADHQASPLEQALGRKNGTMQDRLPPDLIQRNLKQFGYDFFRHVGAVTPSDDVPVGPDYVVGPGDSLRIDLWGAVNAHHEVTVNRNGEILIPKAGAVRVWGMSFAEVKDAINRAVSRYFRGYELNVTLGTLRTIQVFLVGEVQTPGAYTVSSLSTPLTVLSTSGGPTKNGSLRSIRIMRKGKQVQEFDLYDFVISGDRSKDMRLENGDTIVVPMIGEVVAVAGEVKRPGIYEIKGGATLSTALALAGGLTPAGDGGRIQLERLEGNRARVILDHESREGNLLDSKGSFPVKDHDMIKIFPVERPLRQVVSLVGHVTRPGDFQYRQGMRLKDLIPSFDALLPEPCIETAVVTRLLPPDFHRETISINLKKAFDGDEKENILLMEQDRIHIFSRDEMSEKRTVTISGYVVRPDTYDHFPNMTVRDLISTAGGIRRNAYLQNAELSRVSVEDDKAQSIQFTINIEKAMAGDPTQNIPLLPDDILIVRSLPDWLEATDKYVTVKGEVRFPGSYAVSKGEKLSAVIERAGGFSEKAYLKGAKFTRRSVQQLQQKRLEEVVARTEDEISKRQGELASVAVSKEELEATKSALDALMKDLQRLKKAKAEGRVVIQLASLPEFKKTEYDLEVMGGDVLEIPQLSNVVSVIGDVFNPTTLVHRQGKPVSYYIKKAGGATRNAEENDMYIIKADGSVFSRQDSESGLSWDSDAKRWRWGGGFFSADPDPGDTIVVPQKLDRTAWIREIKDITAIISQIALSAGVVIAAGH